MNNRNQWKNFWRKWLDFFLAVLQPESIALLLITLFCSLTSFLPFDSANIPLTDYISLALRTLAVIFFGCAATTISKNRNSVIDRDRICEKGVSATRNIQDIKKEINDLLKTTPNMSKREMDRCLTSLLRRVNLAEEDWLDILPELNKENDEKDT